MKRALILLVAVGFFAGLVALISRPDKSVSRGASFEVLVVRPILGRPLLGLLPSDMRFDHTSPGAAVGSVGQDRLELTADGWDLLIEMDGEGRVAAGTHLVYPMEPGERSQTLRCRPAAGAYGYLHTTPRAEADLLDGEFRVELEICENADGNVIEWPPAPLTVRGSFEALPPSPR